MQKRNAPVMMIIPLLAGCAMPPTTGGGARYDIGNVPEAVSSLAAPGQDLATARLLPEDNCYWYEHSGPVETTLLPLRTPGGNPICLQRNES